ncbi:hypothetical protein IDQ04_002235 [Salmonella enterica]|nr:hypothetical protein [Salmonella enterica]
MSTITRERLKQIYAECEERDPTIFEIRELVRIALASLEAEAEPVVPESISVRQAISALESADCVTTIGQAYKMGWNACRAALLHGAEPVSQTYELPQTQFEQVADLYEMQFDDGRTCAFHTDGTKAAQWLLACDGNKVQEYVRIERYQEAVIGNTPVQSPIDHGYRPECECSGCKATARICAELNNEEAEIFADGYNAAMLKVNKNASTELPNDANLSTNSPVIPDGYALVPVEPTDEMIAAAMNCEDVLFNSDESFCVQFGNIYEAMLAVAPKPEATNGK